MNENKYLPFFGTCVGLTVVMWTIAEIIAINLFGNDAAKGIAGLVPLQTILGLPIILIVCAFVSYLAMYVGRNIAPFAKILVFSIISTLLLMVIYRNFLG